MASQIRKRGTSKATGRRRAGEDPIATIHRRFALVMEQRLATVEDQTRTNYLTIMTSLTAKLEVPGKPLAETVRELMAEAGPLLFAMLRS